MDIVKNPKWCDLLNGKIRIEQRINVIKRIKAKTLHALSINHLVGCLTYMQMLFYISFLWARNIHCFARSNYVIFNKQSDCIC